MKKILTTCILVGTCFNSEAKVIDKIAGVINDKVFTLSEVKRVKKQLILEKKLLLRSVFLFRL